MAGPLPRRKSGAWQAIGRFAMSGMLRAERQSRNAFKKKKR